PQRGPVFTAIDRLKPAAGGGVINEKMKSAIDWIFPKRHIRRSVDWNDAASPTVLPRFATLDEHNPVPVSGIIRKRRLRGWRGCVTRKKLTDDRAAGRGRKWSRCCHRGKIGP